jgi:hypothetical protein
VYHAFLQGGAFGTDLDELHLCRANQSRDPVQIAIAVAKYTSSFGTFVKIPHLEGEKVFGSTKCKVYLPPRSEAYSHQHDRVNFSRLKVANAMAPINQSSIVDVGETNGPNLVITHNDTKVLECLCGDDIWRIEHYPPKSNSHCSMLQKDIKHYYKAIIISK